MVLGMVVGNSYVSGNRVSLAAFLCVVSCRVVSCYGKKALECSSKAVEVQQARKVAVAGQWQTKTKPK